MTNSGLDSKRFKATAQFDFLEIIFRTTSRTNLKAVQPKLNVILNLPEGKKASVSVLDEAGGRSASVFAFRIQNPKNKAHVQRVFAELKRRFDLEEEPIFSAIELAFDLKRRPETSDAELAEATAHLYKFASYHAPSQNQRIYRGRAYEVPARMKSLIRHIADGYCIAEGSQRRHTGKHTTGEADPISCRHYFKRTDDGEHLPSHKWSARTERTLQGDAMPFRTLEEFMRFDPASLQVFFGFRKLKDELNRLTALILRDYALSIFDTRTRNRREGGTRDNHPATLADSELNDLVRHAFRCFVKRWNKTTACENSVTFDDQNPDITDTGGASANTYNNNSKSEDNQDAFLLPEDNQDNHNDTKHTTALEELFPELFNAPDTEEDIRIAKLFDEILFKNSPAVEAAAVPLRNPTNSFNLETLHAFCIGAHPARLPNWKLFEIFAAQAP